LGFQTRVPRLNAPPLHPGQRRDPILFSRIVPISRVAFLPEDYSAGLIGRLPLFERPGTTDKKSIECALGAGRLSSLLGAPGMLSSMTLPLLLRSVSPMTSAGLKNGGRRPFPGAHQRPAPNRGSFLRSEKMEPHPAFLIRHKAPLSTPWKLRQRSHVVELPPWVSRLPPPARD